MITYTVHRVMSRNLSISLLNYILLISFLSNTCISLRVQITNNLAKNSPTFGLHCKSKDNDLGYHTLGLNQSYAWNFHENFWGTTLFWCNFWWGNNKHIGYTVFDNHIWGTIGDTQTYFYQARVDGLYFYKFNNDTQQFSWLLVNKWGS